MKFSDLLNVMNNFNIVVIVQDGSAFGSAYLHILEGSVRTFKDLGIFADNKAVGIAINTKCEIVLSCETDCSEKIVKFDQLKQLQNYNKINFLINISTLDGEKMYSVSGDFDKIAFWISDKKVVIESMYFSNSKLVVNMNEVEKDETN